jgi:predicted acetyltransferase
VRLIEEDGEARASATVLPLEVFVDGRPVPMGGIAAVATDPAYRRRGFAGELMRDVLRTMRERRMHLSMLHPFAQAFYRAYGWELATETIAYALKPTDLPTSSEQRRLRTYREEDLPEMVRLLEGEAARLSCCVRRRRGGGETF